MISIDSVQPDARLNISAESTCQLQTESISPVLSVTDRKGIGATEKEEQTVAQSIVAFIPAAERHRHGAAKDTACSHLSYSTLGWTRQGRLKLFGLRGTRE